MPSGPDQGAVEAETIPGSGTPDLSESLSELYAELLGGDECPGPRACRGTPASPCAVSQRASGLRGSFLPLGSPLLCIQRQILDGSRAGHPVRCKPTHAKTAAPTWRPSHRAADAGIAGSLEDADMAAKPFYSHLSLFVLTLPRRWQRLIRPCPLQSLLSALAVHCVLCFSVAAAEPVPL